MSYPVNSPEFKWEKELPYEARKKLDKFPKPSELTFSHLLIYTLTYKNNKSEFNNDTIFMANQAGKTPEEYGKPSLQVSLPIKKPIYKDWNTNKSIAETLNGELIWVEKMPYFDWTIHWDETDEYLGYKVIKATTTYFDGKEVTAWFAEEIPISDGPDFLSGLPGLILKCRIWNQWYKTTDISITKTSNNEIILPEVTDKKVIGNYNEWKDENKNKMPAGPKR